ncbi:MAG: TIGR01212 family radical SAM protein [Peptococcaceae bacterium]|nr:TIGR01212 family radical SAM protein [Peptococcaceae bacterium]
MAAKAQVWGDKRYHSLNFHLRQVFGQKVFKISLDAGFNCPNRDGSLGTGGCIYCSARGSGDFAGDASLELKTQFQTVREKLQTKWSHAKYIGYFQAYTNTYGSADDIKNMYIAILTEKDVVGLAIATRPDCLPAAILDLLQVLNRQTYLWVELGLQTSHDRTLSLINRGHDYQAFVTAVEVLCSREIQVCAHIILGLPGESREDMMATASRIARLPLAGLKIHLLHVLRGTPLAQLYEQGGVKLLGQKEYTELVVDILEILPPHIVIHRLTGDGPPEDLIGPLWSRKKWEVLNGIDAELQQRNTWQGRLWQP